MTTSPPPDDESGDVAQDVQISPDKYTALTGESLGSTLDIRTWEKGVRALQAFERLEREVAEAERMSDEIRQTVRSQIFELITSGDRPREAGVYRASFDDVRAAQANVLFNGLVEGCDANSHVFHTLPMQIIQIAVAAVTYNGEEQTWANRIFRRDIQLRPGASLIDETIELLKRRSGAPEAGGSRRKVTDQLRRGIMSYMERSVLADGARAPWRMGHGNPLAYEILTGSGQVELIRLGVPVLRRLILEHKKFVFVPSSTQKEHYLTIGDALEPLEYAIIDDAQADLTKLLGGGYRGEWRDVATELLEPFCREAGPAVLMGVYRASSLAPARMFYAHREFVHEAARIALADSILQEHRGFPMLIDMADGICTTYFGAETLNRPTQAALSNIGQPYRYLDERTTRT
ncbi:MAG TPA: hypothetical protein VHO06_15640 [Polyangia bacterium]|nr:hypothetical protein [Polyangia bacterium]